MSDTAAPSAAGAFTRRTVLLGVCACCCPRWSGGKEDEGLRVEEVAPGIHIRRGVDEDASAANDGGIANIGFIVGRDAVAVVDPGGSLGDGRRLRATIRRTTNVPVRHVLMSHVHPDHIFGAAAFIDDRPEFIGHAKLPNALAQRGTYYRDRLESILGPGRAGSIVAPTRVVSGKVPLDLGGRVLELTAHGIAHTNCDLSVLDRKTGTLLPADLLFVERIPSLDGSLTGWLRELAALQTSTATRAVPGHGPTSVAWPAGATDLQRYLNVLLRETKRAIAAGVDIRTAASTVGLSERGRWKLFDDYHGHNVTQAYKELEWD